MVFSKTGRITATVAAAAVLFFIFILPAFAYADITLNLSKSTAAAGDIATASGTTVPNSWVPLKVLDKDSNIILFDTTKADSDGNYRIDFKVPEAVEGVLTVVVGEGGNVVNALLTVGTDTDTTPADLTAPTWSSPDITAGSVTAGSLTLTWSAATDNVGVTGYRIYSGTTLLTESPVTGTSYNVTGLTAGTGYTFKVEAGDAAGNWSINGPSTTVTTLSEVSPGSGGPGGSNVVSETPQAVTSATGAATVTPSAGGTVSLGSEAAVEVPANALAGTGAVEIKVRKVTTSPAVPAGFKLAGSVYEFSVGGKNSYNFNRNVTIKLSFDPGALSADETAAIYYYDETLDQWVNIGGTVSGNTVTVQVNHFTKFAVMTVKKEETEPTGTTASTLNDITGHWAMNNINKMVALGSISGYPDGSFKPDKTVSRAEFATVLVKAFQLSSQTGKAFADTAGHWAKDIIATAAYYGIVSGYDADTFGPDNPVTREQMAAMIMKAAGLTPVTEELTFFDSDSISGWARSSMAAAVKNGIINGYPDNTVRPQGNATRAEAVTVIMNALPGE